MESACQSLQLPWHGMSGSLAVPLAKSLGARLTGVSSTRNIDFVRSLGADESSTAPAWKAE